MKMFLIVPICILYYFCDAQPTNIQAEDHKLDYDLETDYIEKIVKRKKNMDPNYTICDGEVTDYNKTIVMTACKNTMDKLRKTVDKYYENLYVYYHYHEIDKRVPCQTSEVKLSDSNEKQLMVPCYGRPIIVINKEPVSYIPNFYKILIYPTKHTFESWLVFEYDLDTKTYALIRWYDISNMMENLVPVELLLFPPPTGILKQSEIYTTLYPFFSTWNHLEATHHNHVLFRIDSYGVLYICSSITQLATHEEFFAHPENLIPKPPLFMLTLKLNSPKDDVNAYTLLPTPAYSCDGYLVKSGWYLFMAPGNDAIILGKITEASTSSSNQAEIFKVAAIIKNMHWKFLDYICPF